jgi:hypothetical protein
MQAFDVASSGVAIAPWWMILRDLQRSLLPSAMCEVRRSVARGAVAAYRGGKVAAVFDNLLPDSADVRRRVAERTIFRSHARSITSASVVQHLALG